MVVCLYERVRVWGNILLRTIMKKAIIDVGGGMKSIYGAGIYDYFLDNGITFDIAIGVSAGSSNLATYKAGQKGRLKRFYQEYAGRKEYMGIRKYVRTGNFVNLPYIFEDLSSRDGEDPLDWDHYDENPMDFWVVSTDAISGTAHYFRASDDPRPFEASCNLPLLNRAYMLDGHPYYDGGLTDPVPYEKAFELGAEKVVIVLTRPEDKKRIEQLNIPIGKVLGYRWPGAGKALLNRSTIYNEQIRDMQKYKDEGKIFTVYPEHSYGVTMLLRCNYNSEKLDKEGYRDGEKIRKFLES